MGEAFVRVEAGIIDNLAVLSKLTYFYIHKSVTGIYPAERERGLFGSQPGPMLMVHEVSVKNREPARTTNVIDSSVLFVTTK